MLESSEKCNTMYVLSEYLNNKNAHLNMYTERVNNDNNLFY